MCLVLEPTFSFLVEQHGAEVGDRFSFEGKDSLQHQTSVSPAVSQVTSGARVQTKRTHKGSSSSVGMAVRYSNQKEKAENPSQQSQTLNDKYFYNTLAPETRFSDLFYLHEQYFEIQENDFSTSSSNVNKSVTNKSGKKRLILDLRILNKLLWKQKMRFEDWKIAVEYFEKDSFCFKFDLSKGYHHINIFPGHQTFLGFSIKGKYYCFTVLPFGLSSAPFVFSKVLREMVKYWRSNSIKIVMFLDDGWGTNSNRQMCSADACFVRNSLEEAGFVINYDKSIWEPVQKLEWLGLFWDSEQFSLYIPERRINDLRCCLEELFSYLPKVTARKLAQCVGKVISTMPVIGNIARLMTRRCYVIIENRTSWESVVRIESSDFCITELNFWRKNIDFLNVKKLGGYRCPDTLVFSDASNVACGSYVVKANNLVFHSNWSEDEKAKSSTFRELRAVYLALRAYSPKFQNRCVKWFSDSQNCVRIVSAGSTKAELQEQALYIFKLCLKLNIDLHIQWVPRNYNVVANSISKVCCTDSWGVSKEFIEFMYSLWGPFDIDRFATSDNRKLFRYNSRFFDYQCEAVDAFSQDWKDTNNWLVPPIHLVSKTVFHLLACGGRGCLIVEMA